MLTDILKEPNITICPERKDYLQVIQCLIDLVDIDHDQQQLIINFLNSNEKLTSSTLGKGVMLFKAWPVSIKSTCCSLVIFPNGCEIEAFDDQNITICGLIAAPQENEQQYHQLLISWLRMLNESSLRDDFIECSTPQDVITLIREEEKEIESAG
jgi:mannitol/fructose-specific phosphotransferase system IIA component (Ntr-type)